MYILFEIKIIKIKKYILKKVTVTQANSFSKFVSTIMLTNLAKTTHKTIKSKTT